MKKIFFLVLFSSVLWADSMVKYTPTEIQSLKLKNLQLTATLQQVAMQQAQQNFANAITALSEEANKVKKENNWPDSTAFDIQNVSFCDKLDANNACPVAPPPPAPAPEKK